jgi:hypothetical protein
MKELKKTYFHSFSGAENEPRDFFSYFLWRRERSKETSTPSKASPVYGEDATQENAETAIFLPLK